MTIALDRVSDQVRDRSPLTQKDKETIASVLCWDMCALVQPHQVITIAIQTGIVQVQLTGSRTALLSVETFKRGLEQITQKSLNEDIAYIEQLEQKLEKDSSEIETDRVGRIYRVWRGIQLLGTFYRLGNEWVAEPSSAPPIEGLKTAVHARSAIVGCSV